MVPGLVSIVLATYNGASRIAATIESVRSQTYASWELIVAVDGSTDATAEIVASFEDTRISMVMLHENQGPSAARNAAVAVADGEYVAFIDDDDEWLPDKLARQVALLRTNADLGLVHGGVLDVMADGRRLERMPPRDAQSFRANLLRDRLALSTVVVRRSALDRAGGFDTSLRAFEDWELWTRILKLYPSDFVADIVVVAHQREGSITHGDPAMLARNRAAVLRRRWGVIRAHGLGKKALAYHHYYVGGLLLVDGRSGDARRRATRSMRLVPSPRAAMLYLLSYADDGITRTVWGHLQRLRRSVRA